MSTDGEDRISLLPDDLIHHILSFIPSTKFHAQTSLVSKRWRHLWTHHPHLHFSIHPPSTTDANYLLSVDRCINSFSAPSLHCFNVGLIDEAASYQWLCFAALKSVQHLTVHCRLTPTSRLHRIPRSLFHCRHISQLAISRGRFQNLPSNFQGFPNLKHLSFLSVHVSDWTLRDLLDSCPLLESLTLDLCEGLTRLDISTGNLPNLTHLVLVYFRFMGIELSIEAPKLRTLHLEGGKIVIDWKGFPAALTKATLAMPVTSDQWMNLARAVSDVSVLHACSIFFTIGYSNTYSREPVFRNLKELNCDFVWIASSVLVGLANCLGGCPLLEKLFIGLVPIFRAKVVDAFSTAGREISTAALLEPVETLSELDYSLHHLKTITMEYFLGTKDEMRLAQFLLGKAFVLEKFVVHDFLKRGELKLQEIFANVPRASSHVQMIFCD